MDLLHHRSLPPRCKYVSRQPHLVGLQVRAPHLQFKQFATAGAPQQPAPRPPQTAVGLGHPSDWLTTKSSSWTGPGSSNNVPRAVPQARAMVLASCPQATPGSVTFQAGGWNTIDHNAPASGPRQNFLASIQPWQHSLASEPHIVAPQERGPEIGSSVLASSSAASEMVSKQVLSVPVARPHNQDHGLGGSTLAGIDSSKSWPKMSDSVINRYTKIFYEVDTDKDGKISGIQARELFVSWNLPQEALKQVWDFADRDHDSMLSLQEFCSALYFMECHQELRETEKHKPPGKDSFLESVSLVALLKECTRNKDLHAGANVHADILKKGLLREDSFVASAVVNMYAKCGALAKAKEVLDTLPAQNVASWNALLAGYVKAGQGQEALDCFEWMHHEGIFPTVVTFICILKACSSVGALEKGKLLHDEIIREGLLGENVVLGAALVDMYAKCGALAKAKEVLEGLPAMDVVSWNSLIAGYVQRDCSQDALKCFELMQQKGYYPNAVTFICILKACGNTGALDQGEDVHCEIVKQGLLHGNIMLHNALVDMYVKCHELVRAKQVLEQMPVRDVVSWSTLIAGYAQGEHGKEALDYFERMQCEGLSPDAVTFSCVLKACGSIEALDKGRNLHSQIIQRGFLGGNSVLGTALVAMYAKCDVLVEAKEVLQGLSLRNVVSWSSLIAAYVQREHGREALNCLEQMQCEGILPNAVTFVSILKACDTIGCLHKGTYIHSEIIRQGLLGENALVSNTLAHMYTRCGAFSEAKKVIDGIPSQDAVSWSSLITGYVQEQHNETAIDCFEQMHCDNLSTNAVTFIGILRACSSAQAVDEGDTIYSMIVRQGLLGESVVLGNALVNMYAKCGALLNAKEVHDGLLVRNVVSWSALIGGFVQEALSKEAFNCFEQMQCEGLSPDGVTFVCILKACNSIVALGKGEALHAQILGQGILSGDIALGGALIDMYVKCGSLEKANQLLGQLPIRDVASWNALIGGYTQQDYGDEAISYFEQMQKEGLVPDAVAFASVLNACSSIGAIEKGEDIHCEIVRQGLLNNSVVLGNTLVDMYAKCGALAKAKEVHESLPVQEVVSWNALIAGYVQGDNAKEAFNCFEKMQRKGVLPDTITFVCLLKACGSLGAVERGESIHTEIVRQGLLEQNVALGGAFVDMYASCGAFGKAKEALERLPVRNVVTWNSLISGYAKGEHGKEALICLEGMHLDGLSPDEVTFICVLNACGRCCLMEEGHRYFMKMSVDYGIPPTLEHHTCIVNLFGHMGLLDKAALIIYKMPFANDFQVWLTLLTACKKWGNAKLGRWAFECAVQSETCYFDDLFFSRYDSYCSGCPWKNLKKE